MPLREHLTLLRKTLPFLLSFLLSSTFKKFSSLWHRYTYRSLPNAKPILVIGGSFAGTQTVRHLCSTIPSGHKVIWIEKNSHLHYVFAFPRFSVLSGDEGKVFIPYTGIEDAVPRGSLTRVQGSVVSLDADRNVVKLDDGSEISYEYLVMATGSSRSVPSQLLSTTRSEGIAELQGIQNLIKSSQKIAVIGAGAVGVELAADIKDVYPDKEVTLVHSRKAILNRFGERLSSYVLGVLENELGVKVLLGERPDLPVGVGKENGPMMKDVKLVFSDGMVEEFDLVIPCTGQTPNTSLLFSSLPHTISPTGHLLVKPTLQITTSPSTSPDLNSPSPTPDLNNIFALGDVAQTSAPLMARAAFLQSSIISSNITSSIHGHQPKALYKSNWFIEGAIKLTLGAKRYVIFASERDGTESVLIEGRNGRADLDLERAWGEFGVDIRKSEEGSQ
ncbi:hypothetical protein BDV06DRAFT_230585 [Aspergillus oleicola]